jgi:hypothetical protein
MSAPASAETAPLGSLPRELEIGESQQETQALNALSLVQERLTKMSLFGIIPIVRVDTWNPVVGKYRYSISRSEFFERVGAPDLAQQQTARDVEANLLFFGGFGVCLAGIAVPFITRDDDGLTSKGLWLGAGLFLAGIVLTNVGSAISGPVASQRKANSLAQRYNQALKLRVTSEQATSSYYLFKDSVASKLTSGVQTGQAWVLPLMSFATRF